MNENQGIENNLAQEQKPPYDLTPTPVEEMRLFYTPGDPKDSREYGCIGYLRADFGQNGDEFWPNWFDKTTGFKTQAFKDELDSVINTLRENGLLKDRHAMAAYLDAHKGAKLLDGGDGTYGFKITTERYVYYLRCNARRNDYHLYCFAYDRGRLEKNHPLFRQQAKKPLAEQIAEGKQKMEQQNQKPPETQKTKKREVEV